MNLLLAVSVEQWVLLGVLLLVLILSPVFMMAKKKKAMASTQKMIDELKKGDTILTAAGVIGKVVSIDNKEGYKTVTIETGDEKHKGYMCIDIASVYYNLSNPVQPQNAVQNNNANTKETKTEQEQTLDNKNVTENIVEEIKETTVEDQNGDKKVTKTSKSKNSKKSK